MKNKNLSWKVLITGAAICYILKYLLGGVIGDILAFLGLILLALGIVGIFQKTKSV